MELLTSWSRPKLDLLSYVSLKQDEESSYDDSDSNSNPSASENKTRPQWRFIISLILNIGFLLLLVGRYLHPMEQIKSMKLVPSPIPDFPHEVRTFKMDPLYMSLPTNESKIAWEALAGPNPRAAIHLENSEKFHYPDDIGGLSVFHQLHCLGSLRHFMWELVHQRVDTERMLRDWPEDITSPTVDQATNGLWHYSHCFDYLRQGLQCSADTSLEFVSLNNALTGLQIIDGLDYPHECTNWDALWDYAVAFG